MDADKVIVERIVRHVMGRIAAAVPRMLADLREIEAESEGEPQLKASAALLMKAKEAGCVSVAVDLAWQRAPKTQDKGDPEYIDPRQPSLPGMAEEGGQ
jgi:hypothetical protein